jgi:cytochrome c oxidase cbb3-type subunit 3
MSGETWAKLRGATVRFPIALVLASAPLALAGPERPAPTSPAIVRQGRALYLASCAHCHGADATGDEGPDLHDVEASDRSIANTITRGIKGEMPSFRRKLGPDDVRRLTAYVRSLP